MKPPEYPPFSGEHTLCPKCGNVDVSMRWHRRGTLFPGSGRDEVFCNDGPMGADWPEWMLRRCDRCGYDWAEQCP